MVITTFRSRFSVKKVSAVMTLFGTVGIRYVVLQTRAKSFVLQRIRVYYVSLLTHNVIADVSFHIVGLHANERAVSVFGKNPMLFAVFWRISVRLCGFRTSLTTPSRNKPIQNKITSNYLNTASLTFSQIMEQTEN